MLMTLIFGVCAGSMVAAGTVAWDQRYGFKRYRLEDATPHVVLGGAGRRRGVSAFENPLATAHSWFRSSTQAG